MKETLILELQLLTGVITNDLDYLVFLILKDGVYFDTKPEVCVESELDQWLKTLEEIG